MYHLSQSYKFRGQRDKRNVAKRTIDIQDRSKTVDRGVLFSY